MVHQTRIASPRQDFETIHRLGIVQVSSCRSMAVEEIAIGGNPFGQRLLHQGGMLQGLVGDQPGAVGEQDGQRAGQPPGELSGGQAIAAPDVGVCQRRLARQAMPGARQRIAELTQEQMVRIWPIGRMGADFPLEHEDLSRRQKLAQMIVGPTVPQAELKHGPTQIGYPNGREVEASALCLEPTDEAVETTHSVSFRQIS
jgi:hypothetical protein